MSSGTRICLGLAVVGAAFVLGLPPTALADDVWLETAKLEDPGAAGFGYGYGLALEGDTLVVGHTGFGDGGGAFVFERDVNGSWSVVQELTAPDGAVDDNFGDAVGLSGDMLVIGAWGDDDLGDYSGSAYVFERDGEGTWELTAKLKASDGDNPDRFGIAVALESDLLLVGAHTDNQQGFSSGSAYVFERDLDGQWVETAKLLAPGGGPNDLFGTAVAVSGETLLVGASENLTPGSAYVFERDPEGGWMPTAKLTQSDGDDNDDFGAGLAIDGDTIVVGAWLDDDLGSNSGSLYVFEADGGGGWLETGKDPRARGSIQRQLRVETVLRREPAGRRRHRVRVAAGRCGVRLRPRRDGGLGTDGEAHPVGRRDLRFLRFGCRRERRYGGLHLSRARHPCGLRLRPDHGRAAAGGEWCLPGRDHRRPGRCRTERRRGFPGRARRGSRGRPRRLVRRHRTGARRAQPAECGDH